LAPCNTILSQILEFIPRHEFEALANEHHSGRDFRKASRWSQFATPSRMNESKLCALYEVLFGRLLTSCQSKAPNHDFQFKNALYSLGASTIYWCLSTFPWAGFRSTKGVVKRPVGLNDRGNLPEFVAVTVGKKSDFTIGRIMKFPNGGIVAIDKSYNECDWYKSLTDNGISFVTHLKSNAKHRVVSRRPVLNLLALRRIKLSSSDASDWLQRLCYRQEL
jgi:hypothetical protein